VEYCEVCDECDRQDRMLVCDFCDAGYHTDCLDPPLDKVPSSKWLCPLCFWYISVYRTQDGLDSDSEEGYTNWDSCTLF
jgi:hypothetical protein